MRACVRYALLLVTAAPTLRGAQGFSIYELGTCSMGRAGTGVAAPCPDGSGIFFNPAGLAGLKGWHVSAGGTLIKATGDYTSDATVAKTSLDNPWIPVPQAYLAFGATPKLGIGIGLFAPYGLETRWPLSFDGRFTGYDNIIRTIYIQPTAAYQVTPWLSLGAGLDIVDGKVELNQRLDLADQALTLPGPTVLPFTAFGIAPGTDFANAHLEASKTKVTGAHFGALAKVNDRLAIGARYLMRAKLDYTGTATFSPVATGIIIPTQITLPGGLPPIPAGASLDAVLTQFGVFTTLFVVVMGGIAAVQSVPRELVTVSRVYGASRWQIVREIYLPSMAPILLEAARLGMIFNITAVLLCEIYGARDGIGYRIAAWGENLQMPQLYAALVIVAIAAVGVNEILRVVEERLGFWRRVA